MRVSRSSSVAMVMSNWEKKVVGFEEGESVSVWMVTRGLSFWMAGAAASALY